VCLSACAFACRIVWHNMLVNIGIGRKADMGGTMLIWWGGAGCVHVIAKHAQHASKQKRRERGGVREDTGSAQV
jgi:hypothetical protein